MAYAKDNTKRKAAAKEVGTHSKDDINEWKEKTKEIKLQRSARPIYTNPILLAYRLARYMMSQDNIEWSNSSGEHKGKPYTVAGGRVAACILSADSWNKYKNGEMDHIVEYALDTPMLDCRGKLQTMTLADVEPEHLPYTLFLLGEPDCQSDITIEEAQEQYKNTYFSDIIKKYSSIIEGQREGDLYVKGRTTDIFVLKQYGWKDEIIRIEKKDLPSIEEADKMLLDLAKSRGLLIGGTDEQKT